MRRQWTTSRDTGLSGTGYTVSFDDLLVGKRGENKGENGVAIEARKVGGTRSAPTICLVAAGTKTCEGIVVVQALLEHGQLRRSVCPEGKGANTCEDGVMVQARKVVGQMGYT